MSVLSPASLRKLEGSVLAARAAAESASEAALGTLGVFNDRRPGHLDSDQSALRIALRATRKRLGGTRELLISECAYEQWHRLLFARFLAENELLLHPKYRIPMTIEECREIADEMGEPDAWSAAGKIASGILPEIFRTDDPCTRIRLAPEGLEKLEAILAGMDREVFVASDALGWVYQFWQQDEKDAVNASGRKIGGADLGPVTQLFTEHYMVRFLLDNSLGAWWAHRHPNSALVSEFEYLRRDGDGEPAAGAFESWPERVAEVTLMDPCCGSGHFLVEAFTMLWQMRAEEEGLDPVTAQDAVLADNLFGLELDSRCVQIAMFALALRAWLAGGGWRELPVPNVACSGTPATNDIKDWTTLARGDQRLENVLVRLHELFQDADTLGSLIDPRKTTGNAEQSGHQQSTEDVDWDEMSPLLERAGRNETTNVDRTVFGAGASSMARAAQLLSHRYTLVTTNVPYLKNKSMGANLADFCAREFPRSRSDLATVFLERIRRLTAPGGSFALVTPQSWLFLTSYRKLRENLLKSLAWNVLARLGPGAFASISGEVVQPILTIHSRADSEDHFIAIDAIEAIDPEAKSECLARGPQVKLSQSGQLAHPDARILLGELSPGEPLSRFADSYAGVQSGDYPRFGRCFWEMPELLDGWAFQQSTVPSTRDFGGREHAFFWEEGKGTFYRFVVKRLGGKDKVAAWIRGHEAWGREGIVVSQMGDLPVTRYGGDLSDNNVALLIPKDPADLEAIWAFCSSPEYAAQVRLLDRNMKVTNATLTKVAIDIERWRKVAGERAKPSEPTSDDPTQWLFDGVPDGSTDPLHVALALLLGYRWPEQAPIPGLDQLSDEDGICCLPAVAGEPPLADRLRRLLAACFGGSWSQAQENALIAATGGKRGGLEPWLRDRAFNQHCALFDQRPFLWHIWDGRPDGFSAFVNYHRLDRRRLEKLTYTYLGQDWTERQRTEEHEEVPGASARLAAARELQGKLAAILKGEAPDDVYVRWKGLGEQGIGWEPDLADGVRINIRPFATAGILRSRVNVRWGKDRGLDPGGGERLNDLHPTLAERKAARRGTAP